LLEGDAFDSLFTNADESVHNIYLQLSLL